MSGNQKIALRDDPSLILGPPRRVRRQVDRAQLRDPRRLSVRIECCQPTRSAITVAGIRGTDFSSSRIRGSNESANPADALRSYFGASSLRNAALTVFRETPMTRAISEIDTRSARCSLRISAQSSTSNTRFLLRSTEHRVSGKLVNFRLPRGGHFSLAVDSRGHSATTARGASCRTCRRLDNSHGP